MSWNLQNSYLELPPHFYTKQNPVPVSDPKLVIFNDSLAASLGIPSQVEVFAGNAIPLGTEPLAQAYSGHQFGYFTMLGDGRAILLGEQISNTNELFDIQLKGSGQTPYSRNGDGRAALGPMLREYIISEAMHALGIPTTRSLAVVTTGEAVIRERLLPGAILTRVAKSHLRVGTFEYAFHFGEKDDVRRLADYTIIRHFPDLENSADRYLLMLKEVIKQQAYLISRWQLVGFIHGVMNTDNMAISGETIDFGPCAFMDIYNPATVFSSIDTHGRYAYGNQPKMALWNLMRLAETLLSLLHDDEEEAIKLGQAETMKFGELYRNYWLAGMRAKLGLYDNEDEDEVLISDLLNLMQKSQADYTNTFRALTLGEYSNLGFDEWYGSWLKRLDRQKKSKDEVKVLMMKSNPAIIPRNHRVEEALAAAENGDIETVHKLLRILHNPYAYGIEQEEFSQDFPVASASCYRTFCGT